MAADSARSILMRQLTAIIAVALAVTTPAWGRTAPAESQAKPHTEVHTYFVAGELNAPAVWVHNRCADTPDGRFSNLRPQDAHVPIPRAELRPGADGRWYVHHPSGDVWLAKGKHDFVMIDGKMYVGPKTMSAQIAGTARPPGHIDLARGQPVEFAGTVRFGHNTTTRGRVMGWDNNSGHYQPGSSYSTRTPLPQDKFTAVPGVE